MLAAPEGFLKNYVSKHIPDRNFKNLNNSVFACIWLFSRRISWVYHLVACGKR